MVDSLLRFNAACKKVSLPTLLSLERCYNQIIQSDVQNLSILMLASFFLFPGITILFYAQFFISAWRGNAVLALLFDCHDFTSDWNPDNVLLAHSQNAEKADSYSLEFRGTRLCRVVSLQLHDISEAVKVIILQGRHRNVQFIYWMLICFSPMPGIISASYLQHASVGQTTYDSFMKGKLRHGNWKYINRIYTL